MKSVLLNDNKVYFVEDYGLRVYSIDDLTEPIHKEEFSTFDLSCLLISGDNLYLATKLSTFNSPSLYIFALDEKSHLTRIKQMTLKYMVNRLVALSRQDEFGET